MTMKGRLFSSDSGNGKEDEKGACKEKGMSGSNMEYLTFNRRKNQILLFNITTSRERSSV